MAPGIFRLHTACCTLVIPVRLALCLPLLICTLDAYRPPAAPFPQSPPLPLPLLTPPRPDPSSISASGPTSPATLPPSLPEDTHSGPAHEYEYIAFTTATTTTASAIRAQGGGGGSSTGQQQQQQQRHLSYALTLSFVIAAATLSIFSLLALWWLRVGDPDEEAQSAAGPRCCDEDDEEEEGEEEDARTLVDLDGCCSRSHSRARLGVLLVLGIGTATRLLLGALGTTAMVRVIYERSTIKRSSFIAVQVLGWLLVAVLYCGAFHRVHYLVGGSASGTTTLTLQQGGNKKEGSTVPRCALR